MRKTIIFSCLLVLLSFHSKSQDRLVVLEEKLNQLAKNYPGINETVELSTKGATLQEYIKAIGTTNNINVNIDPSIDIKLSNSFSKVTAKEIFLFLCKRYDLDILFVGPIITFIKYTPVIEPVKVIAPNKPLVTFEESAGLLSLDLVNDTLSQVTREITKKSGRNIIFAPELATKVLNGYVENAPFDNAMEKLAFANDILVQKTEDGFYVLRQKPVRKSGEPNSKNEGIDLKDIGTGQNDHANLIKIEGGLITMDVNAMPIQEVVSQISRELGIDYFLFSDLKGATTLKVIDATYDSFLGLLFNGTDLTFKREGDTYLFGDRNLEGLRQSKLITLQNRTIEKMVDYIPSELKKGIELKIFEDLNGIIVSGSQPRINELEAFLRKIDMVVPMVHIEVIIADVRKSNSLSAGIRAGIGKRPPEKGSTTLVPDYSVTLDATAVNTLLSGINGFGIVNLGAVTPNFYLNLKAMESNGILKLRSTPQIATLNGHEAKISIGQTQYYQEVNNNLVNTAVAQQNLLQTVNWKPVNADLSLTIDPQISGDEQITMTINVKQSSFTERVAETAPPGTINRDFQSLVRVKNGEMIMLGGLEENETNNTGSGLPFLSRIPVLRWFFGERTKAKRESKLTIFIKPTIIYG